MNALDAEQETKINFNAIKFVAVIVILLNEVIMCSLCFLVIGQDCLQD